MTTVHAAAPRCPPPRAPHIPETPQPLTNIDPVKRALRDYQARFYDSDIRDVVSDAKEYLASAAKKAPKPALILDIDETSLSNWQNLDANDFGFILDGPCSNLPRGPCGFTAWEFQQEAEAIAPTLELFNAARSTGVAVFFITGRHEKERRVTRRNLTLEGFSGWTDLILRDDADTRPTTEFKTEARVKVEKQGYTIIANVGDQQSDLDGGHAQCTFKLPNPFYFIP